MNGTIDLLLETPDGYVIIDHKSSPDPRSETLMARAEEYFPQLAAYGRCLELGERRVVGHWIHFGVAGMVVAASPVQPEPSMTSTR